MQEAAAHSLIKEAIRTHRLIAFEYRNHRRVVEPQVFGVKEGKYQLLSFQTGGHSSSGLLPDWRRFDVIQMLALKILDEGFAGPRDYSDHSNSKFDVVIERVREQD